MDIYNAGIRHSYQVRVAAQVKVHRDVVVLTIKGKVPFMKLVIRMLNFTV